MQQVGVDIIEIKRIEKAVSRWGKVFLNRVYTDCELQLYGNRPASLAARFSGKEAVIKVLGSKRVAYRDIEIIPAAGGKPHVNLYGSAARMAQHAVSEIWMLVYPTAATMLLPALSANSFLSAGFLPTPSKYYQFFLPVQQSR